MSTQDLRHTLARYGDSLVHPIVVESWQRSRAAGLDREDPPRFRSVGPDDLQRRLSENRGLIAVAIPHLRWLSRWFHQRPHVAYIADRDGVVLHAEGDPVAIDRYHLSPGYDWSESTMGTNGAGTALAAGVPVAVVGCDHWSAAWKDATCLGAPIHGADGRPVGALDISLDLQPGDADRLAVVAHVAYTISQELARSAAETRSEETEAALARARAADAALRESQSRLTLALEGASMGMWELDLATEICTWSEQTAALFGLPHGTTSLPLSRFLELIHPDDRDAVRQAKASAAAGASYDVEFRAIWPDGTLRWINGKGQVGRTPDGRGLRLIGIGQDITARKAQEAALRLSERRLQAIVDSTPALVYVVDAAGRFRLINRRFAELFALEPADVIGRPLTEYFPPAVADQFAANNRRVIDSGEVCEFEEVVELGGDLRTFISVKAALVDEAGAPYAVCGVSTDITERKRLMSALELAQRQKDAVVATVAHELRQPIAAIGAALAVLQTEAGRDITDRARAIADRQVQQLARLVDDLLDAARIAQGKVTLYRKRVALRPVLEAAVAVVQPLVQQRSQQLQVDLPADAIWLDADAARLQQVFSNLLTNAVKFTGPAGRITVAVEPASDTVAVRIRDTGRGIAPETLPHIFDLFTQAAPDGQGLGIGLAVVRRLVEGHGGSIEGRSDGPDRGSEFIVRLPLAPAAVPLT